MQKLNQMKEILRNSLILSAVMCAVPMNAQFNTVSRISNKITTEVINKTVEIEPTSNENQIKKKAKKQKKISTSQLQKEIDSLKVLFKESLTAKLQKEYENFKTAEDSKTILIEKRISEIHQQKNFIDEHIRKAPVKDKSKLASKFYPPLKGKLQISSKFGNRSHPIFRTAKMHAGTDFKANYDDVYTVLDGIVIKAGWDSKGGGKYMKIKHSDSFSTSYLHLSEQYYQEGDYVRAGYVIAKSGNSGNSTGPHLHFSVQENGKYINPMSFLGDLSKANNFISTHYEK